MRLIDIVKNSGKRILVIFMSISLSIGCAPSLYPSQYYGNGLRVKTSKKSKVRKQIKQYDNCSLLKKK